MIEEIAEMVLEHLRKMQETKLENWATFETVLIYVRKYYSERPFERGTAHDSVAYKVVQYLMSEGTVLLDYAYVNVDYKPAFIIGLPIPE